MTRERIRKIISEIADCSIQKINADTNLIRDLGMDSITIVDLIIRIEEEFKIELPESFFAHSIFSEFDLLVKQIINLKGCKNDD